MTRAAGRVVQAARHHDLAAIFVDETGLGAGVVDRLRSLGAPNVIGVNFGGAPEWRGGALGPRRRQPLGHKRAEMWGNLRDWLKAGGALPDDPELRSDLTGLEYGYSARSEIQLEKKEDMKRRGLASPDIGDALALTFAQPVVAYSIYHRPGEVRFIGDPEDYDPYHDA